MPQGSQPIEDRLAEVDITDQLARRPSRPPDHAAENAVLVALASELARQPRQLLQKLAESLVAITRADSAGVSILESNHGEPLFRWHAIAGSLRVHANDTMAADGSPCGLVLEHGRPLLIAEPARHFTGLPPFERPIGEALLVPFYVGGMAIGTIWALTHEKAAHFESEDVRLLESLSRIAGAAWQMTVSMQAAEEARATLERRVQERTGELLEAQAQLSAEMTELDRLHDLASRVLFQRDVRAALQEVLDAAIELHGADLGDIKLLDPATGELEIIVHRGLDDSFAEAVRRLSKSEDSAARRALQSGERVTLVFERDDAGHQARPRHQGTFQDLHSVVATPLFTRGGAALGALVTYFRRPHQTSARELRVLDLYARHAGDAIERLQAEETLQASEEKFRQVVQSVQDHGIILLDRDGRVASWNEGAERLLQYTAEEVLETSAARFMTGADLERGFFARELQTAATVGRAIDENWMVRKDGSRFWASGTSNALRRPDGELAGFIKIFRDLTVRKATEDALRETDLRLRAALAAGRMGTWHWDVSSNHQIIDDSLQRLLGLPPGRTVGTLEDFLECVHAEDRYAVTEALSRSVGLGENLDVEFRVSAPDGSVRWLKNQGDVFHGPDWKPLFMTGACVDITERKKSEAALASSEKRQRLLAASATRLLGEPNPEVLIRQTLSEVTKLLELDSWFGHLATEDGARLKLSGCGGIDEALCDDLRTVEMIVSDPHETPDFAVWLDSIEQRFAGLSTRAGLKGVACRALHAQGKLIGVICIGSRDREKLDVGDIELLQAIANQLAAALVRQRAEAALVEADRRKDEFLAMLSHELRNPLAPVRSAMDLMRRRTLDAGARQQLYDMVDRQVVHLSRLVDDLLDVSRITRGKIELRRETVEVDQIVALGVEMAAGALAEREHKLTVKLPKRALHVEGDLTRLTQVVFNLLSNSAKYTDPGGQIELKVRRDHDQAVLRVRDNGIGMPPDLVPRVFDLFTQGERLPDRAQGGLGLGLTLVRQLIELHGGTVEASSAGPGLGSEFVLRLPLTASSAGSAQPAAAGDGQGLPLERVLIVDDNIDAAEATMMLVSDLARRVEIAHTGVQALAAAKKFRPQLVLLDLGLPRMDGYEVARRLREEQDLKGIVIAAVTGYGQASDRERTREAGFDEHLVKPVGREALEKLLAEAARRVGAATESN
jgi:PAS domain S-box-containing protein